MTDLCLDPATKKRVSWTIIFLIFTCVIGNLLLIIFELIKAYKKKIVECLNRNKKATKIGSDKYNFDDFDPRKSNTDMLEL
jgi:hypothetical protein